MKSFVTRFVRDDAGQDLIEYGLLIGIITLACITSIQTIGPIVGGWFSTLASDISPAP